jgi:predicted transcriptional regulator
MAKSKKRGRIGTKGQVSFVLRIGKELGACLANLAEVSGRSRNTLIERWLEKLKELAEWQDQWDEEDLAFDVVARMARFDELQTLMEFGIASRRTRDALELIDEEERRFKEQFPDPPDDAGDGDRKE